MLPEALLFVEMALRGRTRVRRAGRIRRSQTDDAVAECVGRGLEHLTAFLGADDIRDPDLRRYDERPAAREALDERRRTDLRSADCGERRDSGVHGLERLAHV